METMVEANRNAGLPPETARSLVTQTFRAASGMSGHEPDTPLGELVSRLATKGGITQQGLDRLRASDAWTAWQSAFCEVCDRLRSGKAS